MTMNCTSTLIRDFHPDPREPVMKSIFQQYERVLVESIINSFGLDFLILDQHGGDVDTIHNVRQSGHEYKNALNKETYGSRGEYDAHQYHSDERYLIRKREIKEKRLSGNLQNAYTGESIAPNGEVDLDHVISAKEIHDDPGRVLAGLKGTDLANSRENLEATDPHTNRTKKADSMDDFLERCGDEYTAEQKSQMLQKDANVRKIYDKKLSQTYYTSPRFAKDVAAAAGNVGMRTGIRQALGFVFAEIWFAVKEEFAVAEGQHGFDPGAFFHRISSGVEHGIANAKAKYSLLLSRFFGGAQAGVLASLTTTLCNIFFSTGKNVIRIIRQAYVSLVEAAKVLLINPDAYSFGERMRATAQLLATGASVVVGSVVSDAVSKTPLAMLPEVGDILPVFCGSFVTGIMSCTLLYFLDRSEQMNSLVRKLNSFHTIESDIVYYRQQAAYFEKHAARLMKIDLETFRREALTYHQLAEKIEGAGSEQQLNQVLRDAYKALNISLPWTGDFNTFMKDKDTPLVFG